jgi:hypothetical protein
LVAAKLLIIIKIFAGTLALVSEHLALNANNRVTEHYRLSLVETSRYMALTKLLRPLTHSDHPVKNGELTPAFYNFSFPVPAGLAII